MKKRFKNFSLISIGVIFGILVSINLSVFADKKEEAKKLPVEDLRIFAEVFGKIKADYVEEVADKKITNGSSEWHVGRTRSTFNLS